MGLLNFLSLLMLDLFNMSGIQVCTSDGNFTSCAIAMLCSADMPARALISNMKAFNGSHACSTCEDEGTTVPGNKLHRIWPFSDSNALRIQDRVLLSYCYFCTTWTICKLWCLPGLCSNYSVSFVHLNPFQSCFLVCFFMHVYICNILAEPYIYIYTQLQMV